MTKLLLKPCVVKKLLEDRSYADNQYEEIDYEEGYYWICEDYEIRDQQDILTIKESEDYNNINGHYIHNCHMFKGTYWQAKSAFFNVTDMSDKQLEELLDICKQEYKEMGL